MPNIYQRLIIEVPAEIIYDAITMQEGLSGWWTPDTKAKPEVNSIAQFTFSPSYFKEMKITELKPSRLVRWDCIRAHPEWVGTNISFELETTDKGTLLFFHHDGWKDYTDEFAACSYNWALFLRSLKLLCETGTGRPSPNQEK